MAWYSKRTRVTGETWEDHARALEAEIEELHEELRQPDEPRLRDQILQDISSGEGQSIEFKTGFAEDDEAIKSLCAFANAKGGTVFFGVKDNRDIVGVDSGIGSNTIENLANKITRNTDPPLTPTIEKVEAQGKIVYFASVPPHRPGELFLAFNTAFIRVGNTNQVMKPDQMRMRLLESANASIEAAPTVFPPWLQR